MLNFTTIPTEGVRVRIRRFAIATGIILAVGLSACSSPSADTKVPSTPPRGSGPASLGPVLGTLIQPTGTFTLGDLQVGQTIQTSPYIMSVDTNKKCWVSVKHDVNRLIVPDDRSIQVTRFSDGYYASQLPERWFPAWYSPSQLTTPDFAAVMNCATPGQAKASGQQIPDRYRIFTVVPDLKTVGKGWVEGTSEVHGDIPPVYISATQCLINPAAYLNRELKSGNTFDVSWDGQQYVIKGPYKDTVKWFNDSTTKTGGNTNPPSEWLPAQCPQK